MSDKYQEHATKALAQEQAKAIDQVLGYPRKGVNVGKGPHAPIPDVYSPGAIGWTATECAIDEDPISKTALVTLTDAAVALGKRDVIVDGKTVKLDLTKDVVAEPPAKFKRQPPPEDPKPDPNPKGDANPKPVK